MRIVVFGPASEQVEKMVERWKILNPGIEISRKTQRKKKVKGAEYISRPWVEEMSIEPQNNS